ncbi:MAG TPA: YdeI/OmpD-associated family protein [Candidatus Polarisedimenticolaceae bacterium]|nr:YdeI/OmpD-associated family protein [Candidatus Polarisedimenticolaceae bacterium]
MPSKKVRVKIFREDMMCYIPVPFDPKQAFGKIRAPVRVTVNGHTYRSTIAAMGGTVCIPLRRSNREAAGLEGGETVPVTIALDEEKRVVTPPRDLAAALKAAPPAWERWQELSFSHQREYAEAVAEAKKPETRARRIAGAVRMIGARPAKKKRGSS